MEVSKELRKKIHEQISRIESAKDIFNLFKALNYPENVVFDISSKRKKESFEFRKDDEQRIKEIYSILSFENKTHIFLLETTSIAPSFIRTVSATFDRQYLNFLLIITIDYSELIFVFPNREKIATDKHKLKLTKLIVKKDDIYYSDVKTISNMFYEEGSNRRKVWRQWRFAFSVERVTENFFDDYKKAFFRLKNELSNQGIPTKEAHEFTLQLLNRLMFIYFISKKEGWLNTNKFVKWLWDEYKKQDKYGDDEFYEIWLKQVFFKAFNNLSNTIEGLPENVISEISNFPYLNGGLFTSNELDSLNILINDELFERIFKFYERYNFTIREDMPLEEEVAVDPQMIGYVYESLANVAEEIYDRHDLGIFYTPRVEVDFMARRVLIEYLSKNITSIPKESLYHLLFDPPEQKSIISNSFDIDFWRELEEVLDNLSAVDPACGSGAFLVGLLNVLTELYRLVHTNLKRKSTDFELKKRIIQYCLYGVDIMPWAIHAAELRLWLQLIVETSLKKEKLKQYPLLPNLDLNLRIGDSLVQEIGGIFFNLRTSDLDTSIKKKLSNLKEEKRNYFDNSPRAKFKSPEEIKEEELRLFEEIIEKRHNHFIKKINIIKNEINKAKSQKDLYGKPIYDKKKIKSMESRITENKNEIKNLNEIKEALQNPEKKPFVWDIDFAEIFGEKNGFDIVIGNPPYVKQDDIAPFDKMKSKISSKDKQEYKEKLIKSVKNQFSAVKTIAKKCDYYIYFYFHGLSLLNEKGVFCFITSNSWLDADYGKSLQEFLLKYVPIIAIYDNPKRTFEHASVNTIIALFGSPLILEKKIAGLTVLKEKDWRKLNFTAKFILFKKPFEEVINTKNLIEIEQNKIKLESTEILEMIKNIIRTENYRVFPITQKNLLEEGWVYPENYNKSEGRFKKGLYKGNKWGKFLRAPDIYFKILEKGKNKLIRLDSVAIINEGRPTGANNYFFLPFNIAHQYKIEDEFLRYGIMKTRGMSYFIIDKNMINRFFLQINATEQEIKKKNVQKYLEFGEKEILPKSKTLKSKKNWWKFTLRDPADLIAPCGYGITTFCAINQAKAITSNSYTEIRLLDKEYKMPLLYFMNSAIGWLFLEVIGRKSLGGGMIKVDPIEYRQLFILKKDFLKRKALPENRKINSIFIECGLDPSKPIREQVPTPLAERDELDNSIFNELELTDEERKEVYWSVCELVKERTDKAKSLKKKK